MLGSSLAVIKTRPFALICAIRRLPPLRLGSLELRGEAGHRQNCIADPQLARNAAGQSSGAVARLERASQPRGGISR